MPDNRELINEYIANLKYDPKTVMVFNGTKIQNIDPTPKDSFDDSNNYIIVTREKRSYEADFDIAVPSSYNDVTYPGALIVASNDLLDGKPQELAAEKSEINILVNLPGTNDISFTVVPTYANVQKGINEVLSRWFEKQGGKWTLPANFQYNSSLVYDERELSLKFGCDISYLQQKLGIDFSSTTAGKKSIYIVRFKQIFYDASAERPKKPADIFSEATTLKDLERAGVSDKHPPLFVKNVQYGRQIYLKFESNLSSTDLEATVKGSFTKDGAKVDVNASTAYKEKLSKIDISIIALGGSTAAFKGLKLNNIDDVEKINNIIWENTTLSQTNPAAPLNYLTVYLKDGASASVHGKTEYTAEKTESYTNGALQLDHNGAYVAQFFVSWDEISFPNGSKSIKHVNWSGNGHDLTAHWATTIPFKGNVRNINIKARGCTGLAWEWWRTSGDEIGLPLVPLRKVAIGGTTLHQTFEDKVIKQ